MAGSRSPVAGKSIPHAPRLWNSLGTGTQSSTNKSTVVVTPLLSAVVTFWLTFGLFG